MTTKYGDLETTFGKFSIRLQSIKIAIFYSTYKFFVPKCLFLQIPFFVNSDRKKENVFASIKEEVPGPKV